MKPILPFADGDSCWNCGGTLLHGTTDPDAPHGYKCRRCPAIPSREKVARAIALHERNQRDEIQFAAALDRMTETAQ